MLKSILKSNRSTIFDLKVRELIRKIIWLCDTLDVFESVFITHLNEAEGLGAKFKELYYISRTEDKAQVWRRNNSGEKDRLLFDIVVITY